ncbi:unnamed protein product, partial [Arctogadus glacialis]
LDARLLRTGMNCSEEEEEEEEERKREEKCVIMIHRARQTHLIVMLQAVLPSMSCLKK